MMYNYTLAKTSKTDCPLDIADNKNDGTFKQAHNIISKHVVDYTCKY